MSERYKGYKEDFNIFLDHLNACKNNFIKKDKDGNIKVIKEYVTACSCKPRTSNERRLGTGLRIGRKLVSIADKLISGQSISNITDKHLEELAKILGNDWYKKIIRINIDSKEGKSILK